MIANLAARGIELQTLRKYATLEAQRARLATYGFRGGGGGADARDVDTLWEHAISPMEKERVAALEMVDEVEEWRLLAAHYCVAWGWREAGAEGEAEANAEQTATRVKEYEGEEKGVNEEGTSRPMQYSRIWDGWKERLS